MTVLVVGINPVETIEMLVQFRDQQGIGEWVLFADAPDGMIREYSVLVRSTKLGIRADGEIVERKSYSSNPPSYWKDVLERMLDET